MVKEAWLAGPAPALADAGYQVVLLDNRGAGASDAPPAPYTVADLAADTAGLIQQLGIGPCRLVGFSLGGAVAEHLAAERADLVRAAALLGSAGPPPPTRGCSLRRSLRWPGKASSCPSASTSPTSSASCSPRPSCRTTRW
jgi:pimeloyl-ACP methyl ester carboxylesterase